MDLDYLQHQLSLWREEQFPPGDRRARHHLAGLQEELGELAHHWLKREQSIRVNEDHVAGMKDALGDLIIFAMAFADNFGWSLQEIVETTAQAVVTRNWKENKVDGQVTEDQEEGTRAQDQRA